MPWCERCDRFLNPNTVTADGRCPSCGRTVDPSEVRPVGTIPPVEAPAGDDDDVRAPWHFWVMVVGVVAYLGWRFVELVMWVLRNWF